MMNCVGNDVFECFRDLAHYHSHSIASHMYFCLKPRRRRSSMLAQANGLGKNFFNPKAL